MDKKFSEQLEEIELAYDKYLEMMGRFMSGFTERYKQSLMSLAEFANYYYGVKLLARNSSIPIPLMNCMIKEDK